jgi:hypothetical protein
MPVLFVSAQNLASIASVKPASIHQRVSLILSNPKPEFFSTYEDVAAQRELIERGCSHPGSVWRLSPLPPGGVHSLFSRVPRVGRQ